MPIAEILFLPGHGQGRLYAIAPMADDIIIDPVRWEAGSAGLLVTGMAAGDYVSLMQSLNVMLTLQIRNLSSLHDDDGLLNAVVTLGLHLHEMWLAVKGRYPQVVDGSLGDSVKRTLGKLRTGMQTLRSLLEETAWDDFFPSYFEFTDAEENQLD